MPTAISEQAAWLGGFVAAEGNFGVYQSGHSSKKFVFKVELGARDPLPLEQLRRVLKVGRIEYLGRRKDHYDAAARFRVISLRDQVSVIVPFMDEHLPPSFKRQQYLAWREELFDYWEHHAKRVRPCSKEGCETPRRAHGLCRRHLYQARLG